jgi:MFS family permease
VIAAVTGPRAGGFRRLWLASLISLLGTWIAAVVLPLRVYDATGSTLWVSALFLAEVGPAAVVGLLLANRLSRLSPRRALVAAELTGGTAYLALIWVHAPWPTLGLAIAAGFAAGVFRPISTASVPRLVADEALEQANASLSVIESAAMVVGQGAGGLLFGLLGAGPALALNAASFFASAALLGGLAALAGGAPKAVRRMPLAQLRHAAELVRGNHRLTLPAVVWPACCLFLGMALALTIPLVRMVLHGSATRVGAAQAVVSAGLVVGSASAVRLRGLVANWFSAVVALLGGCVLAAAAAPAYAVALLALAGVGLANGLALVHIRSSLQRGADAEDLPALAAFVYACVSVTTAAGALIGGTLGHTGSIRMAFAVAGWGVLATAIASLAARARRSEAALEHGQHDGG